jgi:macrolide transport system ATP-binding/permease protein
VLRGGGVRIAGVASDAGLVTRLNEEDVMAIRDQIKGISEVSGNVSGRGQVTYQNKNWSTQVQGGGPSYGRMHAASPEVGRFFTEEETRMRARIAVLGATVVRELFGSQSPIGEMIKINRVSFQVIGLLPEKGANSFRDQDDVIIIPVTTAMHRLLGRDNLDYIDIEVIDQTHMDSIQDSILELMYARKRVPPSQRQDAFQIRNMADIQSAMEESCWHPFRAEDR